VAIKTIIAVHERHIALKNTKIEVFLGCMKNEASAPIGCANEDNVNDQK
jgi:hypothetical protein